MSDGRDSSASPDVGCLSWKEGGREVELDLFSHQELGEGDVGGSVDGEGSNGAPAKQIECVVRRHHFTSGEHVTKREDVVVKDGQRWGDTNDGVGIQIVEEVLGCEIADTNKDARSSTARRRLAGRDLLEEEPAKQRVGREFRVLEWHGRPALERGSGRLDGVTVGWEKVVENSRVPSGEGKEEGGCTTSLKQAAALLLDDFNGGFTPAVCRVIAGG